MNEINAKITKRSRVFKRYASFYNVEILNSLNPELQFKDNESAIKNKLIELSESKGFKFVKKKIESDDKIEYDSFHSNSKAKTIINESHIDDIIESIYTTIISNIFRKRFTLYY